MGIVGDACLNNCLMALAMTMRQRRGNIFIAINLKVECTALLIQ